MTQASESKCWIDELDNVYKVERASNGKFIVARYNQGGHRKLFKDIQPSKSSSFAQKSLREYAEVKLWEEKLPC